MNAIKPTAVFTKDAPCTKVHIWNTFITAKGLVPVMVVVARGEIGLNAPKYLLKNDYMEAYTDKNVDYYRLTPGGQEWLRKGLNRHLELHPGDVEKVLHLSQLRAPAPRKRVVRKAA